MVCSAYGVPCQKILQSCLAFVNITDIICDMHEHPIHEVPLASIAAIRQMVSDGTVRGVRVAAGLTQADIARKVGVRPSAISQWESGRRIPSGERALRYAATMAECLSVAEGMAP